MKKAVRTTIGCLAVLAAVAQPIRASELNDVKTGDTLQGVLSSDIKPGAGPFFITGDCVIPAGTTVTIGKGTVFLFDNFTGLRVQGTLLVQGTPGDPVIFTSKNDHAWNPGAPVEAAQFDWNGIDLEATANGTEISECSIRYSVYGIKAQTARFRIKNVSFAYNGKTNLTIDGLQQKVDILPYSYDGPEPVVAAAVPSPVKDTKLRLSLRYSGLALAVAGCAGGLWALSEHHAIQKRFDRINTPDSEGVLRYSSTDWNAAKRMVDRNRAQLLMGFGICIVGAAGFVATFTF